MKRAAIFLYGILSYAIFLFSFLYSIGFVENWGVPTTIDGHGGDPTPAAFGIDLALLGLFAIQHSLMARSGFKTWLTRLLPAAVERSTYVLTASLALLALVTYWQPIGGIVWSVAPSLVQPIIALSLFGWLIVLLSTFLISHLELFGLSQVFANARGEALPGHQFATPLLYKLVRHPIYLGFLLAFWAAPSMTIGHLLFSVATSGYIVIGILLEERDLVTVFGSQYVEYRKRVPMLLPIPRMRR